MTRLLSSVFLATMLLVSAVTPQVVVAAVYNYAPYLNTTDSIQDIQHSPHLQLTTFTVAAWIKTDKTFTDPRVMIVNKGGFGDEAVGKNMNYGIWMKSDGTIEGGFEDNTGKNYFVTGPKLNDNNWHYVVVTYDGSLLKLYVDGVEVASTNINAMPDSATTNPLRIGANSLFGENDRHFLGYIDEVRVWNRALSASEVNNAYGGTFDSNGLLVYYDGVNVNTYYYNYAPYLNTTDSIQDIQHSPHLQLTTFTVVAWIKTDKTFTDPRVMIVNKGGFGDEAVGKNMNYGIWMKSDGTIEGGFEDNTGKNYFVTGPKLNDNNWHYVVVTYDGSLLKLYVDGVEVASTNINAMPDSATTNPLRIGANSYSNDRYFIGYIDEVRVWNRALSASEVTDAYGGIFDSNGLVAYLNMDIPVVTLSSELLKNEAYYYTLLDDLKQAKSKIHLYVYQIDYGSSRARTLLDELVNAEKRGVDVRVMMDGRHLSNDLKTFFNNNNIPYETGNAHAKVVLIDDKYAYAGSHNWKQSSLRWNNGLSIKSSNPEIVSAVKEYLDYRWTNGGGIPLYDDGNKETFLTKGYYDAVLSKIENADNSIKILMWRSLYNDNHPKTKALWDAVKDAKNRGVDVKVILDDRSYDSIRNFLKSNNIPVKLDPSNKQSTHAKTVVVDDTVFVGSANWEDWFFGSGDVTIKVNAKSMTNEVTTYFDELWQNGRNI